MKRVSRRAALAGVAAALAGCTGRTTGPGSDDGGGTDRSSTADATTTTDETTTTTEPSGAVPLADRRLTVQHEFGTLRQNVESGGPPKDGIPSIDEPKFWDAAEADEHLTGDDVVFGLARDGEVKAYPQFVLVWHEICNDVVAGDPVSVTYCPLTGTAMGFRRGDTTFGVSGRLLNNNLVMYDRETDSRWPQVLGTAISGPHEGQSLQEFRLVWTTWDRWKTVYPDTRVLSTDTGSARDYGRDPYGSYDGGPSGYYAEDGTLFPPLADDDRFGDKEVFVGTRTADGAAAFREASLREQGVLAGDLGGTSLLAAYDHDLDAAYVYRNPEGASYEYADGRVTGPDGTGHDPDALPLDRLYAFDAMWFAWSGFYPETGVFE